MFTQPEIRIDPMATIASTDLSAHLRFRSYPAYGVSQAQSKAVEIVLSHYTALTGDASTSNFVSAQELTRDLMQSVGMGQFQFMADDDVRGYSVLLFQAELERTLKLGIPQPDDSNLIGMQKARANFIGELNDLMHLVI